MWNTLVLGGGLLHQGLGALEFAHLFPSWRQIQKAHIEIRRKLRHFFELLGRAIGVTAFFEIAARQQVLDRMLMRRVARERCEKGEAPATFTALG